MGDLGSHLQVEAYLRQSHMSGHNREASGAGAEPAKDRHSRQKSKPARASRPWRRL